MADVVGIDAGGRVPTEDNPASPPNSNNQHKWLFACLNITYDVFSLAVSVVDVLSDILITVHFYNQGLPLLFPILCPLLLLKNNTPRLHACQT